MSHAFAYEPEMTVDEFLEWPGDGINHLHALIDGYPVAMDPGSVSQSLIMGEVTRLLGNHLAVNRTACRVLIKPGVQPRVGASKNVRVPDLAVASRPQGHRLLANPLVVIEILSPSNVRETRETVRTCLSITSLREVVVIDSVRMRAEHWAHAAHGTWPAEATVIGAAGDIVLDSLGFRAPLAVFYKGIALSEG